LKKEKKINVCIFASIFWPIYPGQGGRHAFTLAETLIKMGHKVNVISSHPSDYRSDKHSYFKFINIEIKNGIRIIRVPCIIATKPGIFRKLIFYLSFSITSLFALPSAGRHELLLGLHPPPPYLILPAFLTSKLFNSKYVLRVTDFWPDVLFDYKYFRWNLVKIIFTYISRIMYKLADGIMAFSPEIKNKLVEFGVPMCKIDVIEMATDTDIFRPLKNVRNESRNLGFPDISSKYVVFYAGAYALTYDFDILLDAAKFLENNKNIIFVLIGDGDNRDHILKRKKILNLNNFYVLPPVSGAPIVTKYINCSDVCVVPLKGEMTTSMMTRPSKIFEFWACEKPVIVASRGYLATFIEKSEAGIVIEPEKPEKLAEIITFLYENPIKAIKMGKKGRALVLERFSQKKLQNNIKKIIKKMT